MSFRVRPQRQSICQGDHVKHYQYHRIERLAQQLRAANIDAAIFDNIMEHGEDILRGTSPEMKAAWMKTAMLKMDQFLDLETRKSVREGCACCLGGKRLETSKAIARDNETLDGRIEAANQARTVFGHSVTAVNGEIVVRFAPEGQDRYRCVCLPKAREPLPVTYCFCCGGHVKHHLQIALGRKLDCEVRSSAVSSGGRKPCVFGFRPLTGL
jgi:hypothetical protein